MKAIILAALIAMQPVAASAAGWVLVLKEAAADFQLGIALGLTVVPGKYATKPLCQAAGKAAGQAFEGVSSGASRYACIPGPQ